MSAALFYSEMTKKEYVILIAGYEGVSEVFGLFTLEEAINLVREFKEKTRRAKKLMKYFKPGQVCLAEFQPFWKDSTINSLECCCSKLPEDLRNKKTWWM